MDDYGNENKMKEKGKSLKEQQISWAGFTFVELILSLGLMVVLLGVVTILINPAKLMAKSRNQKRLADVTTIASAVSQRLLSQKGVMNCSVGELPTSTKKISSTGASSYDLATCLMPAYLPVLPFDSGVAGAHYSNTADYDTGYYVFMSATSGQITITAPGAELGQNVSATR